ncbi:MAG TPA: hypothetical protein P5165_12600 [Spirochaetia bacterium]|nr:hypothetical protein [Spirochaetia bacterium]
MKKTVFCLAYFLAPVPPAILYLWSLGWYLDAYSASVALGVFAFVFLSSQFILASRPRFAVEALGLKGLLSFHGTMPLVALLLAGAHRALKVGLAPGSGREGLLAAGLGFSEDTLQATLGAAAWWLFAAALLAAVLLLANTFWMRMGALKRFRAWAYAKLGLDYGRARLAHNLTVAAGLVVLAHAGLASSSDFSRNPAGAAWLLGWFALSLGLYLRYRLRGRGKAAPRGKAVPRDKAASEA